MSKNCISYRNYIRPKLRAFRWRKLEDGMTQEKKYVVPEGMKKAAYQPWISEHGSGDFFLEKVLLAAVRWLAENAGQFVPSEQRLTELFSVRKNDMHGYVEVCIMEMFLAREPEVPEAIKDLQVNDLDMGWDGPINKRIIEAYRRGKRDAK